MPQQPELMSPSLAPNPASTPGSTSGPAPEIRSSESSHHRAPQRIPPWLESAELFLRVLLRIYIGLAIFYAPWSGQVLRFLPWSHALWDQNPLFSRFPILGVYAAKGAVRGMVSGLGILNLWIALHDALSHRRRRRRNG
jgi:hypothetical protein